MKIIPNLITLGNLFCGIVGIVLAFQTNMLDAAICMVIAAVFDFFDGLVARALRVSNDMGKQLDSLADMVTFGVLPGIMLFHYISIGFGEYVVPIDQRPLSHILMQFIGFLFPLFAALRLAKFNIDNKQTDTFIGVPTPAAALLVASFSLILSLQYNLNMYFPLTDSQRNDLAIMHFWTPFDLYLVYNLYSPEWYIAISVFLSLMMIAPVRMLSFKFKEMNWKANKHRYVFLLIVSGLLIVTFLPYWFQIPNFPYLDFAVIPIIIWIYMLYSVIVHFITTSSD